MPLSIFTFPNRILFGESARGQLAVELATLGVTRPLIVTDPGLMRSGIVNEVIRALERPTLFSDVEPNPTEANVLAGLERYRDEACDGLVAIGGGSPIDATKAMRLLATHEGSLIDYDLTTGGSAKITANLPPMIAIPTTAGTGTEAGRGALIQIPATGRKTIVLSGFLLPSVAICDPELTYGLLPALTAGTGMDAFTHCIESYLSTVDHPICDGIAVEGLRHLAKGLEAAVQNGADTTARRETMLGALLGGISFHKGLGVVHSLSHALGGSGRVHHGTLNAILLPHALRFNVEVAAPRMALLAGQIGLGRGGDGPGHLATMSELLLARLPLPRRLRDLEGLDHASIGQYAKLAMIDHCHRTNPRPCTVRDMEDLLDRAW